MLLEVVEQRCINYIKNYPTPVVPLKHIAEFVREDADCADITEQELREFLMHHAEFIVVEPGQKMSRREIKDIESMGIVVGPRVVWIHRKPTPQEMAESIRASLDRMNSALMHALNESSEELKEEDTGQLREILQRAKDLRGKFDTIMPGGEPADQEEEDKKNE